MESQPSIDQIKKKAYARYWKVYSSLITGEIHLSEFSTTQEVRQTTEWLPEADKIQVIDFAQRVASFIPESLFTSFDKAPTSREGLKALVAQAYTVDQAAHTNRVREMYIRVLSALSGDDLYFSNGVGQSSEDAIEDYFEQEYSKKSFTNLLVKIGSSTMPVACTVPEFRDEYKKAFDVFYDRTKERYQQAMEVLVGHVARVYPAQVDEVAQWANNIVMAENIFRLRLFTNDQETNAKANYSSLSVAAVAFGIDPISQLPLTVSHRPYNYEKVITDLELKPSEDPSFTHTINLVHENIHNVQPEHHFVGDYEYLINELLTDTAAWITVLEAEGQDFATAGSDYLARIGYADLVLLAQHLVKNEIVSIQELIDLGLRQDPQAFLELLTERIHHCPHPEKVRNIFQMLQERMLIRPKLEEDKDLNFEKFTANAGKFLENECMRMWDLTGSSYLGHKMYLISVFEKYQELHPELKDGEYRAMRNNDGSLNDECVKIFYDVLKPGEQVQPMFLSRQSLETQLSQGFIWESFSQLDVPSYLKIDAHEQAIIKKVVEIVNSIMLAGADYSTVSWEDDQKFNALISLSSEIYQEAAQVIDRNWGKQGVEFCRDDLLKILADLAPLWLRNNKGNRGINQIRETVLSSIEALTSPFVTPDGEEVFGPDQLLYWGPTLELQNSG